MAIELFNNGKHVCLMFPDLISDGGEVVQANQFLIVDNGHGMLLDPGGTLTYNDLYLAIAKYFQPKNLDYLFASHADPDVIAALDRWLTGSSTALLISSVWARFMPHLCKEGKTEARIISIPDPGGDVRLGDCTLKMIPAHFMHAEGNFHVYDPVSKILFSGDLGVSLMPPSKVARVLDFDEHISHMRGFHQRYMPSNKVLKLWANMVRNLDIEQLVPQHGCPFIGKPMVNRFIDWIEQLPCGIDLVDQSFYKVPQNTLLA